MRTTKLDEQGKRVRTSEAVFDQSAKKVEWTERDPNNAQQPPRVVTAALDGTTHDIVSAIYFLRTQPLTPGQTFELAISDSGRVYRVPATVVAEKKKMKTRARQGAGRPRRRGALRRGPPRRGRQGQDVDLGHGRRAPRPRPRQLSHDMGTLDIKLKSFNKTKNSVAHPTPDAKGRGRRFDTVGHDPSYFRYLHHATCHELPARQFP